MANKLTILCGVPGSGKSHLVSNLPGAPVVCSADHYFERDGEYAFNPAELPAAHGACLRKCLETLQTGEADIVVDNTNTTVAEVAPYASAALAYGYELEIIKISCDPAKAAARNVHGVPAKAVEAMAKRLESLDLPPWWPVREVQARG